MTEERTRDSVVRRVVRRKAVKDNPQPPRERSPGKQARIDANASRMKLHIGASRIRNLLLEMEDEEERVRLIRTLWPGTAVGIMRMIARYPGETVVNGSNLVLPQSWSEFE